MSPLSLKWKASVERDPRAGSWCGGIMCGTRHSQDRISALGSGRRLCSFGTGSRRHMRRAMPHIPKFREVLPCPASICHASRTCRAGLLPASVIRAVESGHGHLRLSWAGSAASFPKVRKGQPCAAPGLSRPADMPRPVPACIRNRAVIAFVHILKEPRRRLAQPKKVGQRFLGGAVDVRLGVGS